MAFCRIGVPGTANLPDILIAGLVAIFIKQSPWSFIDLNREERSSQ
jgi:hypothetical protein